jgi:hypothetical protein
VGSNARVDTLCSSCSLQKHLERWPAALYEAGRSVLMLMKGSKILRIELNTVHLYKHYSLFMPNKLQYNWCGDYCECVWPAQLPVLTKSELCPSWRNTHDMFSHQDRAGYNSVLSGRGPCSGPITRPEQSYWCGESRWGLHKATLYTTHQWVQSPASETAVSKLPMPITCRNEKIGQSASSTLVHGSTSQRWT